METTNLAQHPLNKSHLSDYTAPDVSARYASKQNDIPYLNKSPHVFSNDASPHLRSGRPNTTLLTISVNHKSKRQHGTFLAIRRTDLYLAVPNDSPSLA